MKKIAFVLWFYFVNFNLFSQGSEAISIDSSANSNVFYERLDSLLSIGISMQKERHRVSFAPNENPYTYPSQANFNTTDFSRLFLTASYGKFSGSIQIFQEKNSQFAFAKMQSFRFSFGGKKIVIEPSFVKYNSFYDKNSPKYDTIHAQNDTYHTLNNMQAEMYMIRTFYFFTPLSYNYSAIFGNNYYIRDESKGNNFMHSYGIMLQAYLHRVSNDTTFWHSNIQEAYKIPVNKFVTKSIGLSGVSAIAFSLLEHKLIISVLVAPMIVYQTTEYFDYQSVKLQNSQVRLLLAENVSFSIGNNNKKFFWKLIASTASSNEKTKIWGHSWENSFFFAEYGLSLGCKKRTLF